MQKALDLPATKQDLMDHQLAIGMQITNLTEKIDMQMNIQAKPLSHEETEEKRKWNEVTARLDKYTKPRI